MNAGKHTIYALVFGPSSNDILMFGDLEQAQDKLRELAIAPGIGTFVPFVTSYTMNDAGTYVQDTYGYAIPDPSQGIIITTVGGITVCVETADSPIVNANAK